MSSDDPSDKPWWRWLLTDLFGGILNDRIFLFLLFFNLGLIVVVFNKLHADAATAEEFGSFAVLLSLCLAVAEHDLIQFILGSKSRRGSFMAWVIFCPILLFAFAVGAQMHQSRLADERSQAQSREDTRQYQSFLKSPEVQKGMKLYDDIQHLRATTMAATQPAR